MTNPFAGNFRIPPMPHDMAMRLTDADIGRVIGYSIMLNDGTEYDYAELTEPALYQKCADLAAEWKRKHDNLRLLTPTDDDLLPEYVPDYVPEYGAAFPLSVFPATLAELITAYSTATGSPPEFLAGAMLTVAGALIGNRLTLSIGNFTASGVVWIALVAPSGSGKTEPINAALRPLRQHDNEVFAAYRTAYADYEAQAKATKKKKDMPAPPPQPPQWVISDSTMEALQQETQHGRGIIIYRDELVSWYSSFNQYRSGADLENWLSLWSGVPVSVSRKSGILRVENPHVSVIGGIQNDRLKTLATDEKAASGFFGRMLFCYPETAPPPLLSHEQTDFRAWMYCVGCVLDVLDSGVAPAQITCHYSHEARQIVQQYDDELRGDLHAMQDGLLATALAKLRIYLHRLALIMQALRYGADETNEVATVGTEAATAAVQLCKYFRACAYKVVGTLSEQEADAALKKSIVRLREQGQSLATIAQRLDVSVWQVRKLFNSNPHKSTRQKVKS